jgi:hypothetical protein
MPKYLKDIDLSQNNLTNQGNPPQLGMSNIGNTAGTSGTVGSRLLVVGGPNVTASQSVNGQSATISLSVAAQVAQSVQTQNVHNVTLSGNTTGTLAHISSGTMTLAGGPNVTLSQSGNAVSISAPPPYQTISMFENGANQAMVAASASNTNGTASFWPILIPQFLTATKAAIQLSVSGATGSTGGASLYIGLYSIVNSTQLTTVSSASKSYSWTSGSGAAGDWGGVSAIRNWTVPLNISATPGNYVVGALLKSTNAGSYSIAAASEATGFSGEIGAASNVSIHEVPFLGTHSVATSALPGSVARSEIQGSGASPTARNRKFILLTNL